MPRNSSAEKDDSRQRWPVQLLYPPSPDGAQAFGFWPFKDFSFWGKNNMPGGLPSWPFPDLFINSVCVRTAFVLGVDHDPNRLPWKHPARR